MVNWSTVASYFKTTQNKIQPKAEANSNETEQEPDVPDSEELNGNASDGEGNEINERMRKYTTFKATIHTDDLKFVVGLLFSFRDEFKKACKHRGVKWGRKIRFKKNIKEGSKLFVKAVVGLFQQQR
ncbi:hypothetical protein ACH5RR_040490 [Cinchona calisaya]|uniref:Uncharacterized protein n=1 Tax=Cinchona calisaya TaxID=153742 RepID=A0ABD2XSF9_9GENT